MLDKWLLLMMGNSAFSLRHLQYQEILFIKKIQAAIQKKSKIKKIK
jgi:hypothetical protein